MENLPCPYTTKSFRWESLSWLHSEFFKISCWKTSRQMKEKVVLAISLLRYELSNIFVGRSMYMQQRTGSFKEGGSKNTFYRFLNATKTNWLRFTSLLAADIVNNYITGLTDDKRKKYSSLMTAFLTVPAARKQNCGLKFLTKRICISKNQPRCLS